MKDGLSVLDLGCANGRLLKLFEKHKVAYTGVDANPAFLKATEKYARSFSSVSANFVQSDMRKLSLKDNTFDLVFCIASLHHIPSTKYQLQMLEEMCRVMKPGGMLLMTNWDLASQERYVKKRDKLKQEHPELFEGLEDRDFLIEELPVLQSFLKDSLALTVHPDKIILRTVASGLDFLGWVHPPTHRTLRAAAKRRMFRRLQENPTKDTKASYLGLLSHGDTFKLSQDVKNATWVLGER